MTVTTYDLPARALQPSAAHHNRAPLACAALALGLALTACGGSTKPSSNTASVSSGSSAISATSTAPSSAGTSGGGATSRVGSDVCSRVSAAEAQAVVGESLEPGVPVKGHYPAAYGTSGSCLYTNGFQTPSKMAQVNVNVLGTTFPRSEFNQFVKADAGSAATPVTGLGETAISIPGAVFVYDHGIALFLQIVKSTETVDPAVIINLLRKALSRAGSLR